MEITPEKFEEKMKEIFQKYDTETAHWEADKLMCRVLKELGYKNGVKIFKDAGKWYA